MGIRLSTPLPPSPGASWSCRYHQGDMEARFFRLPARRGDVSSRNASPRRLDLAFFPKTVHPGEVLWGVGQLRLPGHLRTSQAAFLSTSRQSTRARARVLPSRSRADPEGDGRPALLPPPGFLLPARSGFNSALVFLFLSSFSPLPDAVCRRRKIIHFNEL